MRPSFEESRTLLLQRPALRIEGATARGSPGYVTGEVLTPTPQLLIPLRGAFTWRVGSSESLMTANQILLIAAGSVSSDVLHDDRFAFLLLTPQFGSVCDQWGQCLEPIFADRSRRMAAASTSAIQHAACALWNVGRRADCVDELAVEETAADLLGDVATALQLDLREHRRGESRLIARAKELIGAGRESLSLSQLARELGRSPAYLTDVFRRHEGVSIGRYQRRLRLSRALMELPDADDLTALALDLGFSSHAHFSTAFRAAYRESPSQYRARLRRRH